ncbi:MAG TPA: COX15/CtaA family protein, partial [Gemmatimonadales bacterium]|nr:COX15/CtaA family protein [Gemmatimonadales bacterium]
MTESPAPAALRRWALAGSALTFVLIVIGGVVRITGSGMGCGDHWPLCNGEWFPPLDLPTFIEIFHRWVAALVSLAVAGTVFVAWRRHRGDRRLLLPAVLGAVLLVVQVLLGAVTVKLELPPRVVIVHLLNAMLVMGAVLWTALETGPLGRAGAAPDGRRGPRGAALAFAGFGLVVVLWGAQVANLHAGFVCRGFPLCQGAGLGPPDTSLGPLHWTHRILAYAFLVVAAAAALRLRGPATPAPVRRAAQAVLAATVAQVVIAAGMVLLELPAWLRALHLAGGAAVWAALVVLVHRVARTAWPAVPARTAALAEA